MPVAHVSISELLQKERSFHEAVAVVESLKIPAKAKDLHEQMRAALAKKNDHVFSGAKNFASTPGLAQAALQTAHIPAHAITPAAEVAHKLLALTLTLVLVFGSYAALNTDFEFFAKDSTKAEITSVGDAFHFFSGGGATQIAQNAQDHLAVAADHPGAAFAAAGAAVSTDTSGFFSTLAQTFSTAVNNFFASLFDTSGRGSLAVEIVPQSGGQTATNVPVVQPRPTAPVAQPAPVVRSTAQSFASAPSSIVNNYPVIERVVNTERIIGEGGITESVLDARLQQLEDTMNGKILAITSVPTPPASGGFQNQIALTQIIDSLNGTNITNPTINGGTISNATITGGNITATGFSGTLGVGIGGTGNSNAPTKGVVIVGNSAGAYDKMS
jgi:hypothetical protein